MKSENGDPKSYVCFLFAWRKITWLGVSGLTLRFRLYTYKGYSSMSVKEYFVSNVTQKVCSDGNRWNKQKNYIFMPLLGVSLWC